MLINVFNVWFNPEGITKLTEESTYESRTPYTKIHFDPKSDRTPLVIMNKKPEQVGIEINKQVELNKPKIKFADVVEFMQGLNNQMESQK